MPRTQPFEFPDFYLPWPARCSPHVDGARAHTKHWAREVGILDTPPEDATPQIWDEAKFDSMDIGLFCALAHPDALPPDLELIADWIVWAFYFDDLFVEVYKRIGDANGLRAQLVRLALFMPFDQAAQRPEPANPIERALLDLWRRTMPAHSVEWRRRFHTATTDLLDVVRWELRNISADRVANPIEFVQWRRPAGGALWTAFFVEHANLAEVPDRAWAQRPLRVLTDAFADAVHYRNDLFSYDREVNEEGELANFVLVLERFFGIGVQPAAEMVNDLLSSRLHQFEHTAVTEVPVMFEERLLTAPERTAVALYIKGLQDFQAGSHEWHLRSSRYTTPAKRTQASPTGAPTGLGTAAARAFAPSPESTGLTRFRAYKHVPHEQVGPIAQPDFYMPYRTTLSPHYGAARRATLDWARAMGMLDPVPGLLGSGIWSDDVLESFDLCQLTARSSPRAARPALILASAWIVWGLYFDDLFWRIYQTARDVATAKAFHGRLELFLPLDGEPMPGPLNPVERGLLDLWPRTTPQLSAGERASFRETLLSTSRSWLWELDNHVQNRMPDPIDYIEMRRWTVGAEVLRSSARLGSEERLTSELACMAPLVELDNAAADYISFLNDIVSYQSEIQYEGSLNNIVLIAQSFLAIAVEQAVLVVNDLMTRRLEQFERIVATELPRAADERRLDPAARAAVDESVQTWIDVLAALHDWHVVTGRYRSELLPRRYAPRTELGTPRAYAAPARPTGRGTSASDQATRMQTREAWAPRRARSIGPAHRDRADGAPEAGLPSGAARAQALPEPSPHAPVAPSPVSPHRDLTPRAGRPTRRRGGRSTVAVFGAGIAGMTAAHELAERGFDVSLYERRRLGRQGTQHRGPAQRQARPAAASGRARLADRVRLLPEPRRHDAADSARLQPQRRVRQPRGGPSARIRARAQAQPGGADRAVGPIGPHAGAGSRPA